MRCDVWWRQWEGALGQWLRGQLDQRGIDAPAYGRYVLSLLTRPLRPDDLSPETVINGKAWDKRNKSKSTPIKIEALKRSAAVQCLLKATDDQGSGIEQLVDELCEKIKEIEETRGGKRISQTRANRRERTRTVSPREMARLYYAAFPALGQSKESPEPPQPCRQWPSPPRERRNTYHAPRSTPRHPKHRRDKSKNKGSKEALPEWVTNEAVWDIEAQDPIKDFIKTITLDEGYSTCDNVITDDHNMKSKRLYERDCDSSTKVETIDSLINRDWTLADDFYAPAPPPRTPAEEESIAKFEAKFDRSLEALWSKEQNYMQDDEHKELPVDFQDMVSSSSDKMFDCCSSPGKTMPLSLTGSIWSNGSDCNPSECAFQNVTPGFLGAALESESNQRNVWGNEDSSVHNNDTMEALYNKLQPLNLYDPDEKVNNMEISSAFDIIQPIVTSYPKWSTECEVDDSYNVQWCENLDSVPAATTAIRSLTTLNHSLQSSFTEVIPKAVTGYIGDSIKRKNEEYFAFYMGNPMEAVVSFVKPDEDLLSSSRTHFCPIKQEPFYVDSTVPAPTPVPKVPVVTRQHVESVVNYENGVTFSVDSDWDSLKFRRSSTGRMFLESDINPPTQYMEYRTQGIDYSRLDLSPSLEYYDDGLSASDLVLKFRVCQNEKSVQTDSPNCVKGKVLQVRDEFDRCPISSPESSIFSMDREEKPEVALDTDSELESLEVNWIQCDKCKTNSNSWVTNQTTWQPNRYNCTKIWSPDENLCKACEELRAEAKAKRSETQKSLVYKEQTAREWDELLSDITYVRSFQSEKDWNDDASSTPSDDYYLAPREITVCALDGNFIKSANVMMGGNDYNMNQRNKELYQYNQYNEDKDEFCVKDRGNIVGCILDRAVNVSGEGVERGGGRGEGGGGGGTRKRRHSAGGGGAGKLRCPLPLPSAPPPNMLPLPLPLLTCSLLSHLSLNDRPLTR